MRELLTISLLAMLAGPPLLAQGAPGTEIHLIPITVGDTSLTLGEPVNITNRPGYDNQPSFTPDGRSLLYTSRRDDGQADIYRYDIATRTTTRLTATPESEYSATVMPGGTRFSVIRVEADSTQRLWSFALDGTDPRLVLADVKPVGYHAWSDDSTVAVFVLGNPATLQVASTRGGPTRQVAGNIGRSLVPVPGGRSISFMRRDGDGWMVERYDPGTGATVPVVRGVARGDYLAWTSRGELLSASGNALHLWRAPTAARQPASGGQWRQVASFTDPALQELSRLALSPDGRWLAVVAGERPR
jgi:Tol biopolymer transport system component